MKKIFTLFVAFVASIGILIASDIQIDGIWYDFDTNQKTATVTFLGSSYDQYENEYIGDVVIPSTVTYNNQTYSVTSLGSWAFRDCTGLTSITIPESATSIGFQTFRGCTGLTSFTIPYSITNISMNAFFDCSNLTSVTIHSNAIVNTSLSNAFFGAPVSEFILGDSVTSIGDLAFYNCTGLISVTIPNSVTSIGSQAFRGCSSLTSIEIPASVTSIGDDAFSYCKSLTSIEIPDGVTSIGASTFSSCPNLTSVTIPNSVTSIGNGAFSGCSGLTSLTIPSSVTSIGKWAFHDCIGLTSITIPDSVTSIESYTFYNCQSLTSIEISNNVTEIGNYAFWGCSGLTSIEVPGCVTYIGNDALSFCESLTSIICNANIVPELGSDVFRGLDKSIPLYVPQKSIDAYKAAGQWKDFTNIMPILNKEPMTCNIRYVDKNADLVFMEQLTFHVPETLEFEGFTFLKWEFVSGAMSDGLTIQAVYTYDGEPTSAPEVVTNPSNPTQKLIRNGNVYILTDDSRTYTLTGQQVK